MIDLTEALEEFGRDGSLPKDRKILLELLQLSEGSSMHSDLKRAVIEKIILEDLRNTDYAIALRAHLLDGGLGGLPASQLKEILDAKVHPLEPDDFREAVREEIESQAN